MPGHLKVERVGGFAGGAALLYDGPLHGRARAALDRATAAPAEIGADLTHLRVTLSGDGPAEQRLLSEGGPEGEALLRALDLGG